MIKQLSLPTYIESLPYETRIALLSFYYEKMPIEDVAFLFGCAPNEMKKILHHAKKRFRKYIQLNRRYGNLRPQKSRVYLNTSREIERAFDDLFREERYKLDPKTSKEVFGRICKEL